MKNTSAEHGQNMFCPCSAHVLPMFCPCFALFHDNSMNNLLSYCGLVDARISASEKDVPVPRTLILDPVTYTMLNNHV